MLGDEAADSVIGPIPTFERPSMSIKNALASLAVKDLGAAAEWYEDLFGRPADSRPMPEVAEWKFERGGWLQVYQNAERAGLGSVTLAVTSLEEQVADLRERDLDPGAPMISKQARVVMIKDPDGNSIAFAEALDPSMAR
jgi:predicted enzyme related to lactoylglutathione lyase